MRQVALLRGINLGPRNRVAMPALAAVVRSLGAAGVRTHLATGNVLLDSGDEPRVLEERLEVALAEQLQVRSPVVVRTAAELASVVAADPLDLAGHPGTGGAVVTFLSEDPGPRPADVLRRGLLEPDRVALVGRELHLHVPGGLGRSRFSVLDVERRLEVRAATARTLAVVRTLARMAAAD